MPVTLVDRLPLPNLKVYTAGSVLLLSVAVYYALNVTSDPHWRANATLVRTEALTEGERPPGPALAPPATDALNDTRNVTEQFVDVMTFMMQEPLCMWTVINIAYCSLAVFGFVVQRAVFGRLRVAEAQRVKDKFWNYVFYKFIFVFGVINVQYMDEVLLWCSWFTLLGFLHLLGQLCKDRFEYLSSSPTAAGWAHVRLALLLGGILAAGGVLLAAAAVFGLPQGKDTFAFMAAECVLVVVVALHVCARYVLQLYEADVAGPLAYYTHLVFDSVGLLVELVHVVHMVVYSNMLVSMASLVLLMQLRHLLHELQARLQRHRLYTERAVHITRHCPMASKEEVEKNQDNCAICWEPMKEARKLPCAHLFHNSCLCQWVQQDASCPTCRRTLARRAPAPPAAPPARHPHNHLFHFDGSRYVSWLPSFSVEVTRVRADPPPAVIDAMARQVQQLFPQYPLRTLAADLLTSRSPDVTADNILAGRLLPPALPLEDSPPPSPAPREPSPGPPALLHAESVSPPPAPRSPSPARRAASPAPPHVHSLDNIEVGGSRLEPVSFSMSPSEREGTLRRRKEQLVAAARRRYLARAPHAHS